MISYTGSVSVVIFVGLPLVRIDAGQQKCFHKIRIQTKKHWNDKQLSLAASIILTPHGWMIDGWVDGLRMDGWMME